MHTSIIPIQLQELKPTFRPVLTAGTVSKQANKPFLIVSNFTDHNGGIKKTLAIPHLRGRKIDESKVCELNYSLHPTFQIELR